MLLAARIATLREMDDRHYVCEQCGLKWFVPASRTDDPGGLRCGECSAVLTPREEWLAADEFPAIDQSVRA
jgi:DNA-directed RNA polymerase subunit RPC12/RpoP